MWRVQDVPNTISIVWLKIHDGPASLSSKTQSCSLSQSDWTDVKCHSMTFSSIMTPHPAFWSVLTCVHCHFHLESTTVTQTTGSCRKPTDFWWRARETIWCCCSLEVNMIILIPSSSVLCSSHTHSQQRTKGFHCPLPVCLFAALSLPKHMGWPTGCLSVRQQNNETWRIYSNIAGKALWRNCSVPPIALGVCWVLFVCDLADDKSRHKKEAACVKLISP